MYVFQPTYKAKDGRKRTVKKWWVCLRDNRNVIRRFAGFTNRAKTEALGRQLERLVVCRMSGEQPDRQLSLWIEQIPAKLRSRLAEAGLLDCKAVAAIKPLAEHIDDFERSLFAKNRSSKYIRGTVSTLKQVFDACGFVVWNDISASSVEYFLSEAREKDGIGCRASNAKLKAVKQFCKWMVKNRRATESPVAFLEVLNEKTDVRRPRRPLEPDEVRRLLKATAAAEARFGMSGPERALLYRLACETGLRANEIRKLRVNSFDLKNLTVTVEASYSKRRRQDVQPLRPDTATVLKDFLKAKLPTARAFGGTYRQLTDRTADMLKADLAKAKIDFEDDQGRVVDFHSLRHTTGSLLANAGVHPKVAQEIMRHSDINLTMSTYTHVLRGKESEAVAALPDLSLPTLEDQQNVATGTLDVTASDFVQNLHSEDDSTRNSANSGEQKANTERGSKSGIIAQKRGSSAEKANGRCRTRTCDQLIKSQLLYQLS